MISFFLKFFKSFLYPSFLRKRTQKKKETLENFFIEKNFGGSQGEKLLQDFKTTHLQDVKKKLLEKLQKDFEQHEHFLLDKLCPQEEKTTPVFRPCIFVGVNGVGKTTTIGKIFHKILTSCGPLQKKSSGPTRIYVVAGDTFRVAAQEQLYHWISKNLGEENFSGCFLETWDFSQCTNKEPQRKKILDYRTKKTMDDIDSWDLSVYFLSGAKDPGVLLYYALEEEKKILTNYHQQNNLPFSSSQTFLLMDTAGRLPNKENFMKELSKLYSILKKYKNLWPSASFSNSSTLLSTSTVSLADSSSENFSDLSLESSSSSCFLEEHIVLCCDATSGQHVFTQCELFEKAIPLTGVIFNKTEGRDITGLLSQVHDLYPQWSFYGLGIGEKLGDFIPFQRDNLLKDL